MADILSDLYLLSSILKRYEDDGRIAEDKPVVDAIARDLIHSMEQSFAAVFANFPQCRAAEPHAPPRVPPGTAR
jgi:acyl-CoA dehydrogenase